MGVRINMLVDHDLADVRDATGVLARLASGVEQARAVDRYWAEVDPTGAGIVGEGWEAERWDPRLPDFWRFDGPGGLGLKLTASAARVRACGRWRGFLDIEPLRRVHLEALRAVAHSLEASVVAFYGDSDDVEGLLLDGMSANECLARMEAMWGPPLPSVDEFGPDTDSLPNRRVWFREAVGSVGPGSSRTHPRPPCSGCRE